MTAGWSVRPLIYKKDQEGPGNYIPISLTSVPGNIRDQITLNVLPITYRTTRDQAHLGRAHESQVLPEQLDFLLGQCGLLSGCGEGCVWCLSELQ